MGIRSLRTASISTGTKRSKVWDQSAVVMPPNSYESIASAYGTNSSNTITFSSIPSTYKHLQLRLYLRNTAVRNDLDYAGLRVNGDTTSTNYRSHYLQGSNNAASAGDMGNSTSGMLIYMVPNSTTGANCYGVAVIDILDYANTSKYKTARSLAGYEYSDTYDTLGLFSGLWMSTSAITSLSIKTDFGNFTTASHAALYGIKG